MDKLKHQSVITTTAYSGINGWEDRLNGMEVMAVWRAFPLGETW
jgi:hypothetical protein